MKISRATTAASCYNAGTLIKHLKHKSSSTWEKPTQRKNERMLGGSEKNHISPACYSRWSDTIGCRQWKILMLQKQNILYFIYGFLGLNLNPHFMATLLNTRYLMNFILNVLSHSIYRMSWENIRWIKHSVTLNTWLIPSSFLFFLVIVSVSAEKTRLYESRSKKVEVKIFGYSHDQSNK